MFDDLFEVPQPVWAKAIWFGFSAVLVFAFGMVSLCKKIGFLITGK